VADEQLQRQPALAQYASRENIWNTCGRRKIASGKPDTTTTPTRTSTRHRFIAITAVVVLRVNQYGADLRGGPVTTAIGRVSRLVSPTVKIAGTSTTAIPMPTRRGTTV